ncbi:MAG: hypothetical protein V2A62_04210 [Candidatus Woesearchaeota archaeon]
MRRRNKMSGQEDKFATMNEARVKYGRFSKLLQRLPQGTVLPSELEEAMEQFTKSENIGNSFSFLGALSKCYEQIELPEELKPELQRIVNWSEWAEFDASDEVKAQLSADYIHLRCPRYCRSVSG